MILTDGAILEEMKQGNIVIEPFDRNCLGSNSYDVHLGKTLATYMHLIKCNRAVGKSTDIKPLEFHPLDAKSENQVEYFDIPEKGYVLSPGQLYLGVTQEYTETRKFVPWLDGKSSIGRLGIRIHATAGRGDIGFCNHWTLEIDVVTPVRIYAGMPIGQLTYFEAFGKVLESYDKKASAKYRQRCDKPVPSYMWRNFPRDKEPMPEFKREVQGEFIPSNSDDT